VHLGKFHHQQAAAGAEVDAATDEAADPHQRPRRWLPKGTLSRDVIVVVVAAFSVQAVFPARYDWVAHVLAGGGIAIPVSTFLFGRLGRWSQPLAATVTLLCAIVAELTITGPFDPADAAFTVAGAMLVTGPVSTRSAQAHRWHAVGAGAGLLALAVFYHYGIRWGP
jgi:hypothetical protein